MGVSKNRATPKMDGEKNGKPPLKWMIWGETPHYFRKHPKMIIFLVGKPMVVGYHHFRKHPYLISEVYPTSNLPGCHVRNTSSRRRSIFVRPRGVGRTLAMSCGLANRARSKKKRKGPKVWENTTLHPGRFTWNIIMEVWKIIFLSKWVICRFQPLIFQGVHP